MNAPTLDIAAVHRHFAGACFNRAWELLDQAERTSAENDELLLTAMASLWHWSQRNDCLPRNLAVGYWQVSRIHSELGNGLEARRFAARSALHANGEPPFFMAYAHEALARAAHVLKDPAAVERHVAEARQLLKQITDLEERRLLEADLAALTAAAGS